MSSLRPHLLLALLFLLNACSSEEPPPKEAEPAEPSAARPEPEDLEPTAEEVPVVEDFEEQATTEVKPNDLGAQLDAIEEEIELDSK